MIRNVCGQNNNIQGYTHDGKGMNLKFHFCTIELLREIRLLHLGLVIALTNHNKKSIETTFQEEHYNKIYINFCGVVSNVL